MALKFLNGELFAKMFRGGVAFLRSKVKDVNELNVFPVPDGDTGDNMMLTMEGGEKALSGVESDSLDKVAKSLTDGMLLGARGNSGVILSQFFAGIANGFLDHETADVREIGNALLNGVKQAYSSVNTPTEGTILTVARESVEYAVANITDDSTVDSLFTDLVTEMNESLKRTPEMLAVLKEAGVVDSGGSGLKYIAEGFLKILNGEEIDEPEDVTSSYSAQSVDITSFGPDSEMKYGYCTELLLQLMHAKTDPYAFDIGVIKEFLETVGDSIVAYKTGTIVKLHVHTMTPYKVLEFCHNFGEFLTIKIENMSVQHHETLSKPKEKPRKKYSIVAVANGAGIKKLFEELGAEEIVNGGQTMNPSAKDFIDVFERINAEHIFVFPNNGNIILAAKQAEKIYEKAQIHVIESKSIGDCYAALSAIDFGEEDPVKIENGMNSAMSEVETGYLTTAVRNTEMNGIKIHTGEYIGFCGKQMLSSDTDIVLSAMKLLEGMNIEEKDSLNLFYGKDVDKDTLGSVVSSISEKYPDIELYTLDGGQEVYRFIFVAD
mgnify:FL=1